MSTNNFDIKIKYGPSENISNTDITPGTIYFTKNQITGQGEIFYDAPDNDLKEGEQQRFSVIGGGVYVGDGEIPEHYSIKINPNGTPMAEAHYDEANSEYVGGLMSAVDKQRLDHLWKYLNNLSVVVQNAAPDVTVSPEVDTITIVIPNSY